MKKPNSNNSNDHENIEELLHEGFELNKAGFDIILDSHIYKESALCPIGHEGTGLSSEEFDQVCRAPLIILYTMIESDKKSDKKEQQKVADIILRECTNGALLMGRVSENLLDVYIDYTHSYEANYVTELAAITNIVDEKISVEDALIYKKYLLAIAEEVAQASGGFFGFGNKVSAKEKEALDAIALALGM